MMTSLFQAQKQCLFAAFVMTIFVLTTTTSSLKVIQVDATRNAHFTMEFIPTFKNGLPHKCHPDEIKIMETFLGDILVKETGMIEHSVEYLDKMYDPNEASAKGGEVGTAANHMKRHHFSKVRGFDFTFDCPKQGEKCPNNDWCHVLCLDESVKPGHESLTEKATQLKEKLHSHSKTLEGPYNVKCLGQTSDLDFHLLVSVSP
jgi:hypothetical protein